MIVYVHRVHFPNLDQLLETQESMHRKFFKVSRTKVTPKIGKKNRETVHTFI
jgi:hypothetical protein